MSVSIQGLAASPGIAIAKAYRFNNTDLKIDKQHVEDVEREITRLDKALDISKSELNRIRERTKAEIGEAQAEIFSAHILVLSDPELLSSIKDRIKQEKVNAEFALDEVAAMFIAMFEQMDNEYMQERAADIRDVTKRVQGHLLGVSLTGPASVTEEVIILAEDLTPSDTAQLNRKFVKGFVTEIGGRTSHSAIMARSLEIPAVVGVPLITQKVETGTLLIVDGITGNVIIQPTADQLSYYQQKKNESEMQRALWATYVNEPTVSQDGIQVELAANIGTPADVQGALENGAEGVGLFRTEFLYMGRDQLPSEEEQLEAYRTVVEQMQGKPVVIRTLDIGGDKELPYLQLPKEMNPFLGFRAIRLCLQEQEIFRTQLRALLRASAYGNLKIMFPMIATLEEFRTAKQMLLEEKQTLIAQGVGISENIEIGMMVEIPATAVLADQFAKEVDFFSIGTNDLIQYTLAADRMNEQVTYLYQPYHPAILRLVRMVIDAAHQQDKWVGMCGEMAGDPLAIPLLFGLGLDEFSMSAASILPARAQLRKLTKNNAQVLAEKALKLQTAQEVEELVQRSM